MGQAGNLTNVVFSGRYHDKDTPSYPPEWWHLPGENSALHARKVPMPPSAWGVCALYCGPPQILGHAEIRATFLAWLLPTGPYWALR